MRCIFSLLGMAWLVGALGALGGGPVPEPTSPEQILASLAPYIRQTTTEVVSGPVSVRLEGGAKAESVLFRKTRWELKNLPQSALVSSRMESEAMKLTENERLDRMNRIDDYTQFWVTPWAGTQTRRLRLQIRPSVLTNEYHCELVFLGTNSAGAWFAYMPIFEWTAAQKSLLCVGGDDPLAAAARGFAIEDRGGMTANSAGGLLAAAGTNALPYLKPLFADTNTFGRALSVLSCLPGEEATRLLLSYARSPDRAIARRARYLATFQLRPEAEDAYFEWLAEDAGRTRVLELLGACEKLNRQRLAPLLPRVIAAPQSIYELRRALELSRSLAGRDFPKELIEAEETIKSSGYRGGTNFNQARVDAGARAISRSRDVEAAACIGLSLAMATTKGDWRAANEAGISILRSLPGQSGVELAQRLHDACKDNDGSARERLRSVIAQATAKGGGPTRD